MLSPPAVPTMFHDQTFEITGAAAHAVAPNNTINDNTNVCRTAVLFIFDSLVVGWRAPDLPLAVTTRQPRSRITALVRGSRAYLSVSIRAHWGRVPRFQAVAQSYPQSRTPRELGRFPP